MTGIKPDKEYQAGVIMEMYEKVQKKMRMFDGELFVSIKDLETIMREYTGDNNE